MSTGFFTNPAQIRAWSRVRPLLKRAVDSWTPRLGRIYRQLRDARAAHGRPVPTPFGFQLAGCPAMASGSFETEEIGVFLQYLEGVSVCVDIGANIGLYSCLAASRGRRVVAIEPLLRNVNVLFRNLACNGYFDVEVYPLGLSSQPGIGRLYGGGSGASFVPGWAGNPHGWSRLAPVSTLDVLAGARFDGLPLLIKLDVEGFELEVLKGAERTLNLTPKPLWLVEISLKEPWPSGWNDKFRETFEVFWRHGYQARIADSAQRPVGPRDVSRWAAKGCIDFGWHNYFFTHG